MDPLQLREKEIFETLKGIKSLEFVVIGGYAASAYAPPRFSVDCDIVARTASEARKIGARLKELGYKRISAGTAEAAYGGAFERFGKVLPNGFVASVDLLIASVADRGTSAVFTADWIFGNSSLRGLRGRTIAERLPLRILDPDALFVMKAVSCRPSDIRDVFMLAPLIEDLGWVLAGISERCDANVTRGRILRAVDSKQFKDGLQGVFGRLDKKLFERHRDALGRIFK